MNKNTELIKNTIIIFIGRFCTQFISFLLVPIYTNYLLTEDYGYIDIIQTYLALIVPIIILRFDSAVFRFLIDVRNNKNEKNKIISSTLLFVSFQLIITMILFVCCFTILNISYAFGILVNIIFMTISSILLQITRGVGDNVGYSIASIISAIVTIFLNVLFLIVFKMNGESILFATGIANIVCSIFLIFRNKIYTYIKLSNVDKKILKKMTKYSLPMIPDGLSWWIVNVSDRTIITFLMNASANGIYAVSSKFSNILSSIFQIFNMSWQESASMHINDKDNIIFFDKVLNSGYKVFYSICILILVSIPFLFKFIIGDEYNSAYLYIPPLLYGNLFNAISNIIGGVYIAKKDTKSVARTTLLSAIINIIINLFMIKRFGLFAAAISTLISYVLLTLYRYIDVRKYLKLKFNYNIIVFTTLFYIIITILYYSNNIITNVFNFVLGIIFCFFYNFNELKLLIKKFGGKK